MEVITSGYNRKCKDSLGGVKDIYLFPYAKYSRSQITLSQNVLTAFPDNDIFKFEFNGDVNFSEPQQNDDGGKFFSQSLSFTLVQQNDDNNIIKLLNKDYRIVIRDRNNNFRLLGLYNGLECVSINYNSGSSKSDLNGFTLEFQGKEEKESPYFYNLDLIQGVSFRLLQDYEYRLTQSGDFRILQ